MIAPNLDFFLSIIARGLQGNCTKEWLPWFKVNLCNNENHPVNSQEILPILWQPVIFFWISTTVLSNVHPMYFACKMYPWWVFFFFFFWRLLESKDLIIFLDFQTTNQSILRIKDPSLVFVHQVVVHLPC